MTTNTNEPAPIISYENGTAEDSEQSHCNSLSSQLSSNAASPHYDSGNISDLNVCLRPTSLSSAEDDSIASDYGHYTKFQHLLREKDQSLFLALQDVRKLTSELERLSKSEKWYKEELKSQKKSRMEILEKLYTNERKFTQENQRVKNERVALYARCSDIEKQLHKEKENAKRLINNQYKIDEASMQGACSPGFELVQLQQKLADQEQLIEMHRSQKRSLLKDIQKLSCEKDEMLHQLQKNNAELENENRTITKKCMQLVAAKNVLKDELLVKEDICNRMSSELLDLRIITKRLQEDVNSHINETNQKDHEIERLSDKISNNGITVETVEMLKRQHSYELLQKEEFIISLNEIIGTLNEKLSSYKHLESCYDQQSYNIEQRQNQLEERTSQFETFNNLEKNANNDFQSNFENAIQEKQQFAYQSIGLQTEQDSFIPGPNLNITSVITINQELEQLSKKYLEICKLYEKSKFDSDMKDIAVEKFKFEKEKDVHEIEQLRAKLVTISMKYEYQKSLASEFELTLSKCRQEKRRFEFENKCNIENNLKIKTEVSQCKENLIEKTREIEFLRTRLLEMEDMLSKQNEKISSIVKNSSSENGVVSVQQGLMRLQTDKIDLLMSEQHEWQSLLDVINQIQIKGETFDEFDELNSLFEEQNLELIQLNRSLGQDSEITAQITVNYQQKLQIAKLKITKLETKIMALENANAEYQNEMAELSRKNERQIQEFNEDFSKEQENHKAQIKRLQLEVKNGSMVSDKIREENLPSPSEIEWLNTLGDQRLSETSDRGDKMERQVKEGVAVPDRILQNVLEIEQRRKMRRYDEHIRSLLSNMKSYKKKLETANNRYDALFAKCQIMIEVENLEAMKTNLKNIQTRYECSQREIVDLKQQLALIRDHLYESDVNKNTNAIDTTNLIDDYKKLIQQSVTATRRPSTADIYKLINKSNNFVPKLTHISTSIDGLREDIQQICTVINQPASLEVGSRHRKMSLMDELKYAENRK